MKQAAEGSQPIIDDVDRLDETLCPAETGFQPSGLLFEQLSTPAGQPRQQISQWGFPTKEQIETQYDTCVNAVMPSKDEKMLSSSPTCL